MSVTPGSGRVCEENNIGVEDISKALNLPEPSALKYECATAAAALMRLLGDKGVPLEMLRTAYGGFWGDVEESYQPYRQPTDFVRHGWLVYEDDPRRPSSIIDPTRFFFEGEESYPYIFETGFNPEHPARAEYSEGNMLIGAASSVTTCPTFKGPSIWDEYLPLPAMDGPLATYLRAIGVNDVRGMSGHQLYWFFHQPGFKSVPRAALEEVLRACRHPRYAALVPKDVKDYWVWAHRKHRFDARRFGGDEQNKKES